MYRLVYSKEGLIKFISHLDLIRLWQRAFRRAGLPIEMSQGFSPHPIISFGPPLPVGVAGCREMLDVSLLHRYDPDEIKMRLESNLPAGIAVQDVSPVGKRVASLCTEMDQATYEVVFEKRHEGELRTRVAAINAAQELIVSKKTKRGSGYRNIKPLIRELEVKKGRNGVVLLRFTVSIGEAGNLNCYDLLKQLLEWPEEEIKKLPVTRTALSRSKKDFSKRPTNPALG